jgi:CubicO group peptidase (beta-lactamase class C family)
MTKRDYILLMLTLHTIEIDLAKSNGALEPNASVRRRIHRHFSYSTQDGATRNRPPREENAMKTGMFALSTLGPILISLPIQAQSEWPTRGWRNTTPSEVGLVAKVLAALDADISDGKYGYIDSMLVIRHGRLAYERYYGHDYDRIYGQKAKAPSPLVVRDPSGPYNYFNSWWHPWYHRGTLHTMQSVTKSVVSAVIGIAVGRHEFPSLDTPVLSFFDPTKIKKIDDRKRRMTLRHLLTMTAGFDWNEDLPYIDPKNTFSILIFTPDWVQFTIDRPMAHEPGEVFQYNSGATLLLGHIFRLATGVDIEEYAAKNLFAPLGIDNYAWKRTPFGLTDTQEGLFVAPRDIAKVAYLYLHHGQWEDRQIVPKEWVKASIEPSVDVPEENGIQYGYQWWLYHYQYQGKDRVAFAGAGFGNQRPIVLPELDLVFVFTGWNILPDQPHLAAKEAIARILETVKSP